MKRIICLLLSCLFVFAFAACGGGGDTTTPDASASPDVSATPEVSATPDASATPDGSDAADDTIICGVTEFEPMNYLDENGEWTGFDTEFAQAVGEKLGMKVEFVQIAWAQKFIELNAGNIDCIWNGLTANANEDDGTSRMDLCDMSYSYMLNTQCVVVKSDKVADFASKDDLTGKSLAVEKGSAGDSFATEAVGADNVVGLPQQINTLLEVKSGTADGAVIDVVLAKQLVGTGDYTDLAIAFELDSEVYAIGFKTGNTLRDQVNEAMVELFDDGTVLTLAEKYGLDSRLVLDQEFGK